MGVILTMLKDLARLTSKRSEDMDLIPSSGNVVLRALSSLTTPLRFRTIQDNGQGKETTT